MSDSVHEQQVPVPDGEQQRKQEPVHVAAARIDDANKKLSALTGALETARTERPGLDARTKAFTEAMGKGSVSSEAVRQLVTVALQSAPRELLRHGPALVAALDSARRDMGQRAVERTKAETQYGPPQEDREGGYDRHYFVLPSGTNTTITVTLQNGMACSISTTSLTAGLSEFAVENNPQPPRYSPYPLVYAQRYGGPAAGTDQYAIHVDRHTSLTGLSIAGRGPLVGSPDALANASGIDATLVTELRSRVDAYQAVDTYADSVANRTLSNLPEGRLPTPEELARIRASFADLVVPAALRGGALSASAQTMFVDKANEIFGPGNIQVRWNGDDFAYVVPEPAPVPVTIRTTPAAEPFPSAPAEVVPAAPQLREFIDAFNNDNFPYRLAHRTDAGGQVSDLRVVPVNVATRGERAWMPGEQDILRTTMSAFDAAAGTDAIALRGVTEDNGEQAIVALRRFCREGLPAAAQQLFKSVFRGAVSSVTDAEPRPAAPRGSGGVVGFLGNTGQAAWDFTTDSTARALHAASNPLETAQVVGKAAGDVGSQVLEKAQKIGQSAVDVVSDPVGTARNVGSTVGNVATNVGQSIGNGVQTVGDGFEQARKKISGLFGGS